MTTLVAVDRDYESRCIHDQLEWPTLGKSACSICLHLPYEVGSPLAEFEPVLAREEPTRLRWLPAEFRTQCVLCDKPIKVDQPTAWVAALAGSIGRCCEDEVL
ncbi:MAG TPA: hypothetical protein VFW64_12470 [Pseudonocardiaceae bacterium]|nr:hypothetical protein [Pseudonocardiaceae bacterium]